MAPGSEISRYLVFIPFSILVFDYALTFSDEVARYWGTRLTCGTALFYINRYTALFGTAPILAEMLLTTTDPSKTAMCDGFQEYHKYLALLSQILVAVMLIMRTYALYERSKRILALTVFVTVSAIAFALFMILSGTSQDTLDAHLQSFGCPSPTPHDSNIRIAAAWSGMLVFDITIFLLTVYKALRYETRSGSLFSVLFRDGSLYFGIMIVANAANIGTYTMGGPIISGTGTTVVNALSSVMRSRLMLNLRDPKILRLTQRTRTTRGGFTTTTHNQPAITTLMDPYMGTAIDADSMWISEEEGIERSDYEMHEM
ncbi:hypothetical protein MVEN_01333500 [Mycena venus]|uniref:DUF6533 domain-containing protein n=1 Tax=Mycena venus TaxID=2733690 RepID=A0A8H6XXV8_9AGAR|nr:hypothetical protein MVEN_01333500 [Mycena venus]